MSDLDVDCRGSGEIVELAGGLSRYELEIRTGTINANCRMMLAFLRVGICRFGTGRLFGDGLSSLRSLMGVTTVYSLNKLC